MNIKPRNLLTLCVALHACTFATSNLVCGDELGQATRAAIQKSASSIVRIRVIGSSGGDELEVSSQVTTGVVISEDGEILTSVFGFGGQPAAIFVEDSKGDRVSASVVATDHMKKLVLLKCSEGIFVPATFARKLWPSVGAYCVAAGRLYAGPLPAASVGVISATKRIHGIALQTDAKISPVNYGGPLLDIGGDVLGILVPLSPRDSGEGINAGVEWYDSGIGFAIPATEALQTAALLRSGKDRSRGVLGIEPSTRNPLAEDFNIKVVHSDSPASEAGLQSGDRITVMNGVKITRFGLVESVLKSSYAGDPVTMTISRNNKEFDVETQLVDQLKPVSPGYLGFVTVNPGNGKQKNGVAIYVMPNSPLAKQQLQGKVLLSTIGETKISSTSELRRQLRSVTAGQELKITYRKSDSDQVESASVVAELRPNTITTFDDKLIRQAYGTDTELEWKRSEDDVPGGGKVWTYAPINTDVKELGAVLLLSESKTAREVIAKRWEPICKKHNLMVIVPSNSEDRELSREDSEFVLLAVQAVTAGRSIDTRRAILVSGKPQAEMCGELVLNGQQKLFRSATFVETWPRFAGIPSSVIARKAPSFLILNGIVQSRSARALRAQSVKHISESGASVVESEVFASTSAESAIANWALGLKAF